MLENRSGKLFYQNSGEQLQIEAWGKNALRVRATQRRDFDPRDWALDPRDAGCGEVQIQKTTGSNRMGFPETKWTGSITNGMLTAEINENGVLCFKNDRGELLLKEYSRCLQDETSMALAIPAREYRLPHGDLFETHVHFCPNRQEKIFGMGQYQQHELNLKGCVLELAQRNSQVSVPFCISSLGYGFLWNNPAIGSVAFAANGTEWIAKATRQIDYLVIAGPTPAEIHETYMTLTGLPPMMPEYGLGFWQCKLRYASQEELLSVARKYHEQGIPVDVIVCDFFHWPAEGDFCFDPDLWPDPAAMCRELAEMGMRLMVSVWPTVEQRSKNFAEMREKGFLTRCDQGVQATMMMGVGHALFYDATNPDARAYVWDRIRENYWDKGARLYWLDVAEPEYTGYSFETYRYALGSDMEVGNIYPRFYLKGFYDGMISEKDPAPISLIRSAWVGSAKYGALVWSGDILSNFECFHRQVVAGLNIGLAGIPWWTTDIGGFHGARGDDPAFRELFARWFAYGCFCPVMRLHGSREPWHEVAPGKTPSGADNEIWSFGEENFALCRKYIALRERMRDYNRQQMKEAHLHGTPVIRPLFYDAPEDSEAWEPDDEYMFGPDLLVAPVLEAGASERRVYLPAGHRWVNAWTGEILEGGRTVTVPAPLDIIPVFGREGADVLKAFAE